MQGLMMQVPLNISSLIEHAATCHGDTEIVSRTVESDIHRYTYADAYRRVRRIANALARLGVRVSDRVGTLAWNGYRHFELYFATSGMGAVLHTINPRLFPEQIAYIINHAEDRYVLFDLTFAPLIDAIAAKCPKVAGWIALTDSAHMPSMATPGVLCYEELLAAESDEFAWPAFDENTASSLCYTSGTTGNPKGVLYSHRSTVLHALAIALPDAFNLSARDSVLPVVPMFHVNAWGIPYAACAVGCKLVFPGPGLDGRSLYELMEAEQVTTSGGVPTIWMGLLAHVKQNGLKFSTLRSIVVGGAACPTAVIQCLQQEYGVAVLHAWGMTELSPLGTVNNFKRKHTDLTHAERLKLQAKQGRPVYGVNVRITGADGGPLPHDGAAFGDLQVQGPWVVREYYCGEGADPLSADGWFPTGDVATIDPDGYVQITDRSKDVIKSGGEWISSIELENTAVAHPGIAEAAVIGVAHPKWDERPLLIAVRKPDAQVSREELLKFFDGRVAKWWIPDDVVFVEHLPHTGTGKLFKLKLREAYRDYKLPGT